MKIRSEMIVGGLAILFVILLFGWGLTGMEVFNTLLIVLLICMAIILIAMPIMALLKNPKNEFGESFKKQNAIIKILAAVFVITAIFEVMTSNDLGLTSIVFLILMIAIFVQWFFKKE